MLFSRLQSSLFFFLLALSTGIIHAVSPVPSDEYSLDIIINKNSELSYAEFHNDTRIHLIAVWKIASSLYPITSSTTIKGVALGQRPSGKPSYVIPVKSAAIHHQNLRGTSKLVWRYDGNLRMSIPVELADTELHVGIVLVVHDKNSKANPKQFTLWDEEKIVNISPSIEAPPIEESSSSASENQQYLARESGNAASDHSETSYSYYDENVVPARTRRRTTTVVNRRTSRAPTVNRPASRRNNRYSLINICKTTMTAFAAVCAFFGGYSYNLNRINANARNNHVNLMSDIPSTAISKKPYCEWLQGVKLTGTVMDSNDMESHFYKEGGAALTQILGCPNLQKIQHLIYESSALLKLNGCYHQFTVFSFRKIEDCQLYVDMLTDAVTPEQLDGMMAKEDMAYIMNNSNIVKRVELKMILKQQTVFILFEDF